MSASNMFFSAGKQLFRPVSVDFPERRNILTLKGRGHFANEEDGELGGHYDPPSHKHTPLVDNMPFKQTLTEAGISFNPKRTGEGGGCIMAPQL